MARYESTTVKSPLVLIPKLVAMAVLLHPDPSSAEPGVVYWPWYVMTGIPGRSTLAFVRPLGWTNFAGEGQACRNWTGHW